MMTDIPRPAGPLTRLPRWVQWLFLGMAALWLVGVALRAADRLYGFSEQDALREMRVTLDRMKDDGTISAPLPSPAPADDAAGALPPELAFWTQALGEAPVCGTGEVAAARCAMRPGTSILLCRNRKTAGADTDTIRWREVREGEPVPPVFSLITIHPDRTDPQNFVMLMGAQCGV